MPEPLNTEPTETKPDARPQNPYANGANPFVQDANRQATGDSPAGNPIAPGAPSVPNADGRQSPEPQHVGQYAQQQPPKTPPAPMQQNASDPLEDAPVVPVFSKTVWFLAGFLMGIIGMVIVLILNMRRPKAVRNQMMIYSAVGMLAGLLFNVIVLGIGGYGSGTGLIGFMTGTGAGTPNVSSGGIF